ncbi:MAG: hypothetical protein AAF458_04680 [Pseudomonadota bacterium]
MQHERSYEICLGNWEDVLPQVCRAIGAPYDAESFVAADDRCQSVAGAMPWSVTGTSDCTLTILLERHEGYFFGTLTGSGAAFAEAAQMLWDAYLASGGDAQVRPAPHEACTKPG